MTSKLKTDILETVSGSGTIALTNQLSGMTTASLPSLGSAQMPSGSVVQVVQNVKTDTFTVSSTTFVTITGFDVTITPTSASSKVMIDLSLHIGEGQDTFPLFRMYRGSTELTIPSAIGSGEAGMFGKTTTEASARDVYLIEPVNFKFLDTPSTTNAVTYSIKVRPMSTTSRTIYVNRSNTIGDANQYTTISTITATEIAG